jgi:GAF domain-containing protein
LANNHPRRPADGRPDGDAEIRVSALSLHAEYFVPQGFHGVMATPVLANGNHCGVLVAFGSQRRGDFEEPDIAELAGLATHFSRAVGLRLDRVRLMDELNVQHNVLDDFENGILLLDTTLRVSRR